MYPHPCAAPTEKTEKAVEPTSPHATQSSRETVTVQPGSSEMTFSESSATEKEEETSQPTEDSTEKSLSPEGSSKVIRYSEASSGTSKVSQDSTEAQVSQLIFLLFKLPR